MKKNEQFPVAIHILTFIALNKENAFSSLDIANSVNTNPVVIRRILAKLKKANLVQISKGKSGAKLKKDPKDISFLDILKAINQTSFFSIHNNINKTCPTCGKFNDIISKYFTRINKNILNELKKEKLFDFIKEIKEND